MKKTLLVLLLLNSLTTFSQVQINFLNASKNYFTTTDFWNVLLISSDKTAVKCYAEIRILQGNEKIATAKSEYFLLDNSMNLNSIVGGTTLINYFSNETSSEFQRLGYLPAGKYQYCIAIRSGDEPYLFADECTELEIRDNIMLNLINPPDKSTVDLNPLLQWICVPGSGSEYRINLVKKEEKQSVTKAIRNNRNLLDKVSVNELQLNYSANYPMLERGATYLWQVYAIKNGKRVAESDIWSFDINQGTALLRVPGEIEKSYRKVTSEINSNPYLYAEEIKISYDNLDNDPVLSYQIIDLSNGQPVANLPVIDLKFRENLIDISTSQLGLTADRNYLFSAIDSHSRPYLISFVYVEE